MVGVFFPLLLGLTEACLIGCAVLRVMRVSLLILASLSVSTPSLQ